MPIKSLIVTKITLLANVASIRRNCMTDSCLKKKRPSIITQRRRRRRRRSYYASVDYIDDDEREYDDPAYSVNV